MVTAWGLGPAQPARQKVSNQLLPVLRGQSGGEGPRPSGHHTKAPGDPPPEVATAAAEGHLGCLLEDGMDVLLEQSRAFEVGHGAHGPRHLLAPVVGHRFQPVFPQLLHQRLVLAQVGLAAHDDDGHLLAEVIHLWVPPVRDVVEAVWTGDVKAEEQDAGIRVEQGPQAVIVHLPCRVPDLELDGFAFHLQIHSKPLKYRGGVALGEGPLREDHQQRRLPAAAVAHEDHLDGPRAARRLLARGLGRLHRGARRDGGREAGPGRAERRPRGRPGREAARETARGRQI